MTTDERLDRLERENKRLKRWGVTALLVVGSVVLLGQAAPSSWDRVGDVVRARRLELFDEKGVVRIKLYATSDASGLAFWENMTKVPTM